MTDAKNQPIDDNDGKLSDDEAMKIAEEQSSSAGEHADEAGKDDDGRDVEPPKPL